MYWVTSKSSSAPLSTVIMGGRNAARAPSREVAGPSKARKTSRAQLPGASPRLGCGSVPSSDLGVLGCVRQRREDVHLYARTHTCARTQAHTQDTGGAYGVLSGIPSLTGPLRAQGGQQAGAQGGVAEKGLEAQVRPPGGTSVLSPEACS